MKRLLSILLIFSLMLLHQECRVSNIDPEAVTTATPDGTVTLIGTPVLNDNVFVIDSSSAEVISVTKTQIVLRGDLRLTNPKLRGGRLRQDCPANLLTRNMIVGISGLSGLPAVRLARDAECIQSANNGTITTLYYSADSPPLTGPNGVFKYLNLFVKHRYVVSQVTDEIEIDKSNIKVIDTKGEKVNASQNAKITITNKFKSEFTFHIDYGNQQNPDNPELQKLNYLGVSLAIEDSFSGSATIEGEVTASITRDLIRARELGEIRVPVGSTGFTVSITGTLSLPVTFSMKGNVKADGKLLDKKFSFNCGREYRDGSQGITDVISPPVQEGEWFVLQKGSIDLDFKVCVTPTITIYIGQVKWFGIELINAPTKLTLTADLCYGATYNCATTGNGIVMQNYAEIVPKASFDITLLTTLKESVEKYITENESTLSFETKLLLRKVVAIPSEWSWPLSDYAGFGMKDGKWTFPQGAPVTIFKDVLCNGAQILDTLVTTPPSTGPCISSTIVTYLSSPVTVGKRGLAGFTSLDDGAGTTPPVFNAGTVFRVIPTLHSSSRTEDAIYVDKEFGDLRLRFTYPDGKLKVEVKQYDESGNLLLSEQSTSAEVTGQGDVFRICAAMSGTTNGKAYRNRVVIMGRLNNTKNAISNLNYLLFVEGGATPNYLLNGGSIRLFRAERPALTVSQFRFASDASTSKGSKLSLMTN